MASAIDIAAGVEDPVLEDDPKTPAALVASDAVGVHLSDGRVIQIRVPTMGELRGIGIVGLLQGNPDIQAEFLERTSELGKRDFLSLWTSDQVEVIRAIGEMMQIDMGDEIEIDADEQEIVLADHPVTLHRPKVSDLRGTDLISVANLLPEALAIVVPRISGLKKSEWYALPFCDGLRIGMVVSGFLVMSGNEGARSPSA